MKSIQHLRAGGALALTLFAAPPSHAVQAVIDNFSASATQVTVGQMVDFSVSYTILTEQYNYGGSDYNEPAPAEGYQEWYVNWYNYYSESVTEISLQSMGQFFSDYPAAMPGSAVSGGWNFSVLFPHAGRFEVALNGAWMANIAISQGSEVASRGCWLNDPDDSNSVQCDWWNWSYPQYDDYYSEGGTFDAPSLSIEVTPVPEPQTVALWIAGLGLLGARMRKNAAAG